MDVSRSTCGNQSKAVCRIGSGREPTGMHVIIVADHAYINGGQAKVSIESALGLAAAGHDVTYFAPCGPPDARLAEAGVDVVCLGQGDVTNTPTLAFLRQTMWNPQAEAALARVLAGRDPATTIVHVHAWAKAASASIARPLIASRLPRIYTFHEYFLVCPTGGFYDFRRHEPCERRPLSLSCIATNCDARTYPRKVMRMVRQKIVDHVGLREAFPHVITISNMQRGRIAPLMPSGTVWHHVDNPVDVENLGPKAAAGEGFLFVGRLSAEKGVLHFCAAARIAGVTPVIAGDGPQRAEIAARFPEARLLGWQSPAQVRVLLRGARALVFPSVWLEGQPLTVRESLATGTPVIVSDACAGREAIEDGVNGLWFRSADHDDLARALRRMQDAATADRMSASAHARYWRDPLTLERHTRHLERIYGSLLDKGDDHKEASSPLATSLPT
jgi:glycosyltransferase involved in cell wall biosynthesis